MKTLATCDMVHQLCSVKVPPTLISHFTDSSFYDMKCCDNWINSCLLFKMVIRHTFLHTKI